MHVHNREIVTRQQVQNVGNLGGTAASWYELWYE